MTDAIARRRNGAIIAPRRNGAIIAHVDHGKAKLVDRLFRQAGTLGRGAAARRRRLRAVPRALRRQLDIR